MSSKTLTLPTADSSVSNIRVYKKALLDETFTLLTSLSRTDATYVDSSSSTGDSYYTVFYYSSTDTESLPNSAAQTCSIAGLVTVFSTMVDVSGTACGNADIVVEIEHPTAAAFFSSEAEITRRNKVTSFSNGLWMVTLFPNSAVYPSGSFYTFRFYDNNLSVTIPTVSSGYVKLSDLTVVKPLIRR